LSARARLQSDAGMFETLASVPWFVIGTVGIVWEKASVTVDDWITRFRHRTGYRHVPVDDDAQVLRFEDEE
jgi:hypothetical protein